MAWHGAEQMAWVDVLEELTVPAGLPYEQGFNQLGQGKVMIFMFMILCFMLF